MIQNNKNKAQTGILKSKDSSCFRISEGYGLEQLRKSAKHITACLNKSSIKGAIEALLILHIPPLCYSFGMLLKILSRIVHHLTSLSQPSGLLKQKELIMGILKAIKHLQPNNTQYASRLEAVEKKIQSPEQLTHTQLQPKLIIAKCTSQLDANMVWMVNQMAELNQIYSSNAGGDPKTGNQLNETLQQLASNGTINKAHGPFCLGCMQSYANDSPVEFYQEFSVIDTKLDAMKIQQSVADKACALLNNGGGYLIMSHVQNTSEGMKLNGNVYDNQQHVHQWKEWIQSIITSRIFPKNRKQPEHHQYQLETRNIPVKSSKSQIIVSTLIPRRYQLFFVQKKVPNSPVTHTPKFLKKWHKKIIQDVCILKKPIQYYKLMLDLYQEKNRQQKQIVKVKQKLANLKCMGSKEGINKLLANYKFIDDIDEQPKIVHGEQILLIMNQKDNKGIDSIKRAFHKKNINLEVSLPYKSYRNTSHKKIWFLSSSANFKTSHETIDQAINKKYLACIKCTNYLLVKSVEIGAIQQYIQDFQIKFQRNLEYIWHLSQNQVKVTYNLKDAYDFYFSFEDEKQSVFSFIYLQNERIRADFAKKGQVESAIKKARNELN